MGLNLGGGDFDPYVKYNAKSGRWYYKDGESEKEVDNPVFVADLANIKTGWLLFLEGQAPDKVFDPDLTQQAERPTENHKRGFAVRLYSDNAFGGVVEWSTSSMHARNAVSDLYDQYEASKEKDSGKLPVVKCTGSTPMKDKFGTNYRPDFVIEKWVDRPVALDGEAESAPAPTPVAPAKDSVSEF